MNRNDFLKSLGLGGAALLAVYCSGCTVQGDMGVKPSNNIDFILDLTTSANSALNTNGGFITVNHVVVVRLDTSNFVAVTQICSHQGYPNVTYQKNGNTFYCNVHGATYDINGKGLNSAGRNGLTIYKTQLSGPSLHIFS